jgi:hypothetical protein
MNLSEILDAEGKKNMELAVKMREYQDPLLVDFDKEMSKKSSPAGKSTLNSSSDEEDSGSDGEGSDGEESEEQDLDIEFPRNNVQDLL